MINKLNLVAKIIHNYVSAAYKTFMLIDEIKVIY